MRHCRVRLRQLRLLSCLAVALPAFVLLNGISAAEPVRPFDNHTVAAHSIVLSQAQTDASQRRQLFDPSQASPEDPSGDTEAAPSVLTVEPLHNPGMGELVPRGTTVARNLQPWSSDAEGWLLPLLGSLRVPSADPSLAKLIMQALVSPGPLGSGKDILRARAQALINLGQAGLAFDLISQQLDLGTDPQSVRIMLDSLFAGRGIDETCQQFKAVAEPPAVDQLLCLWAEGDQTRLKLNLELAQERGVVLSPVLEQVLRSPDAQTAVRAPAYVATAQELALLRKVSVRLETGTGNPAIMAALSANASLALPQRIILAEQALALGEGRIDDLRALYDQASGQEPVDHANPAEAERLKGAIKRALSMQQIAAETVPLAQLILISTLWSKPQGTAQKQALAMMLADTVRSLPPSAELKDHAKAFSEIAVLANELDLATRWLALLRDDDPVFAIPLITLLAQSAQTLPPNLEDGMPEWIMLADGLQQLPDEAPIWALVELERKASDVPLWLWRVAERADGLDSAEQTDPRLAVISYAAMINGNPAAADPLVFWRVLRGLVSLGMRDVAQGIAARRWLLRVEPVQSGAG